jgi:hypothetical protein
VNLGLAGRSLFDHDHLPAAVIPTAGADVMWALHFPAVPAGNQVHRSDEDVASSVTLAMPADSLLGKCSHCLLLS